MTVRATTELKSKNKGSGIQQLEANTKKGGTKIGFIKGLGVHPQGAKNSPFKDSAGTATISEIAAYNEFGTDTIPERPFLRTTIKENTNNYKTIVKKLMKQILDGKVDADKAVKIIAEQAVSDVKAKIVSVSEPPNSEVTKDWKGSSNPLIDTGLMRQSVSWEKAGR